MSGPPQARQNTRFVAGQTRIRNPQTGETAVWTGNGWRPESAATLAPEAAEALNQERGKLGTLSSNASLGQRFLEQNASQPTGGWVESLPFGLSTLGRPRTQAMRGLSSQMLRNNIQPGTSGTINSEGEMNLALSQYPSIDASGPVNRTRVLNMQIDRDLQEERVRALEAFARTHHNVDQFEADWTARVPELRAQIERRYAQTNGDVNNQIDGSGRQRSNPPPAPRVGQVVSGRPFLGGDPREPSSWGPRR